MIRQLPTPERLRNEACVNMLEEWLAQAKEGKLISVLMVGRLVAGEWQTGASRSENRAEDAGMLMELAMRRLGFVLNGEEE